MRRFASLHRGRRRGASSLAYGLVIGLIAVAAITAVGGVGVQVNALFATTADILETPPTGRGPSADTSPTPLPLAGTISPPAAVTEGSDLVIDVALNRALVEGESVTLDWSITGGTISPGDDISGPPGGSLTFGPGDTPSAVITIPILLDGDVEGDETLELTFVGSGAATNTVSATVTVIDGTPDPIGIAFSPPASVDEGETLIIPVTLAQAPTAGFDVTFDWAVTGGTAETADFGGATSGTLTFTNADPLTADITLPISADAGVEDEDVVFTFSNPTNGTLNATAATISIVDRSPLPVITASLGSASVAEGPGAAFALTFTRSGETELAASIDWAVSFGTGSAADLSAPGSGTVPIPAGGAGATASLSLPVVDDADYEGVETLTLTISNPSQATLSGTASFALTITPNETVTITGSGASTGTAHRWSDPTVATPTSCGGYFEAALPAADRPFFEGIAAAAAAARGFYEIAPGGGGDQVVYCDQATDGGGWARVLSNQFNTAGDVEGWSPIFSPATVEADLIADRNARGLNGTPIWGIEFQTTDGYLGSIYCPDPSLQSSRQSSGSPDLVTGGIIGFDSPGIDTLNIAFNEVRYAARVIANDSWDNETAYVSLFDGGTTLTTNTSELIHYSTGDLATFNNIDCWDNATFGLDRALPVLSGTVSASSISGLRVGANLDDFNGKSHDDESVSIDYVEIFVR